MYLVQEADSVWVCVHVCVHACASLFVLLQNSSVQPWFHLIQFPSSMPLSGQRHVPFHFFILLILFSLDSPLWAAPAVHSAYPSCNSRCFLCSCLKESGRSTRPSHALPFFSCQSALWCVDRWCPWPRYESLSSSPPRALLTHNSSALPNPPPTHPPSINPPTNPPHFPPFSPQPSVCSLSKSFAHWWPSLLFFCQVLLFWQFVVIKFYKVSTSSPGFLSRPFLSEFSFTPFHLCYPWTFQETLFFTAFIWSLSISRLLILVFKPQPNHPIDVFQPDQQSRRHLWLNWLNNCTSQIHIACWHVQWHTHTHTAVCAHTNADELAEVQCGLWIHGWWNINWVWRRT